MWGRALALLTHAARLESIFVPQAAIAFDSVSFSRQGRPILQDISFAVPAGETLALVGRSGAGKSTVLKLTNRLLEADTGAITVNGRDTREWDPYDLRRHAGYVLQEIGLFPHLTAGENAAVVPRLLGWPDAGVRARVDELLALVGLPPVDYRERWPDELSGGQRQRVGIARALAADPPVLLMDEPFGALDPITRSELRNEFTAIQARLHKTVVIVTHDMGEAFALGSHVGVLDGGRLVAYDTAEAVARSSDPHVRRLIDSGARA
jgi:osmoprotectant transport system ATP-binding protein